MKKWYKSKVLWFNVAVAVGAAVEASLTLVQGYFDPRVFLGIIGVMAGINVVLRFLTTTGVSK
jgi:hypothetical protein